MTKKEIKRTEFQTGAYRDHSSDKLDYEGFISPSVMEWYAKYLHGHRKQANGEIRGSDNWQLGMSIETYKKSLVRHTFQAWQTWRGYKVYDDKGQLIKLSDALGGIMFNINGLVFELLKNGQL